MKDQLRSISIEKDVLLYPEGSVLIKVGNTQVLVTASVEEKVPSFLEGTGYGWVTAEYNMLPRANRKRTVRGVSRGKLDGRSTEIQRLIGRSLRAVVNRKALGERTITLDCDVLQGDGGTRCASITGAYVALHQACQWLMDQGTLKQWPLTDFLAAVSIGKTVDGLVLDLCYEEDKNALVDMNLVMNGHLELIEIQGTGEQGTFSRQELNELLDLGERGILALIECQKEVLGIE